MRPPLLDSNEPHTIELYDSDQNLVAFMTRIFTEDTWGLCTKADPDWPEMCVRYGFSAVGPQASLKDIVTNGVRPFISERK